MGITTKSERYRSLSDGECRTRSWFRHLEWARGIEAAYRKGGAYRYAIDKLLTAHRRKMPSTLPAGREIVSALDDESLFPDTIYLMTACGSHPSWDRAQPGRTRLWSLIAYPNNF